MSNEIYQLESKDSMMTFEFISEGPKGAIKKRIEYQITARHDYYNLAFGDIDALTDDFDDTAICDNNDMMKVLATVAETVSIFMDRHPNASIYAEGSTFVRTRLYRISISSHLEEINKRFKIYGMVEGIGWRFFEKNNNYSAFLIKNR